MSCPARLHALRRPLELAALLIGIAIGAALYGARLVAFAVAIPAIAIVLTSLDILRRSAAADQEPRR